MNDDSFHPVHDHLLSLLQSAAREADLRKPTKRSGLQARSLIQPQSLEMAVTELVSGRSGAEESRQQPRSLGLGSAAKICAELGLRYLRAQTSGDKETLAALDEEFKTGPCDPSWASTLKEYAQYFGPGGGRREVPYRRPADTGEGVIDIEPGSRVALFADWGTGTAPSMRVLKQVADARPDVLIHLGDIYYSGTPNECDANFSRPIHAELGHGGRTLPVFALSGNHDMYCGGVGYYDMIDRLNAPPAQQTASYFCLRSTDGEWQFVAMDTGLHDFSPLAVEDAVTYVEPDEVEWIARRVREFPGRTILLSHHQLFSAFSPIGKAGPNGVRSPCNPHLLAMFAELKDEGRIAAWFWGHEHSLGIYKPFAGLRRGRCIGNGAVPVYGFEEIYRPVDGLIRIPELVEGALPVQKAGVYPHGFTMLELGRAGSEARARYFLDEAGKARCFYEEALD